MAATIAPPPPGQVLLIDNDDQDRDAARFLLRASGYRVSAAVNGLRGMDQARAGRPEAIAATRRGIDA